MVTLPVTVHVQYIGLPRQWSRLVCSAFVGHLVENAHRALAAALCASPLVKKSNMVEVGQKYEPEQA